MESPRVEFFDVGAVVPDFTVERSHDRLRELHEQIRRDGKFVAHSSRVLIEAQASQ